MQRRNFLKGLGVIVGGLVIEQAVPFGRVYSFPTKIKCVNAAATISEIEAALEAMWSNYTIQPDYVFVHESDLLIERNRVIGYNFYNTPPLYDLYEQYAKPFYTRYDKGDKNV
jgi:hypothetical protein